MLDIVNGNDLVSVTGNAQGIQSFLRRTAKQERIPEKQLFCS
jgi:hypothetical protein